MKETEFRSWIAAKGQPQNTQNTRISDARRVETHYGDLDELYDQDEFAALLETLSYSAEDQRSGRENPAKFEINGDLVKNLAHYRSTLATYAQFRSESDQAGDFSGADKRITLFDDDSTAHWPVQQTDRETGLKAFRIRGASNRTEDAIPTQDIVEVGKALFLDQRAVRVVRSNNGRRPYLSYGKQKLTSYTMDPEIASALGIPPSGSVGGTSLGLDQVALEKLKAKFLATYPDFLPDGFGGTDTSFVANVVDFKRPAIAKVAELMEAQPPLEQEALGGALLDVLTGIDLPGWRANSRLATIRRERPGLLEHAAARLAHSGAAFATRAQEMSDAIWPALVDGQEHSKPYAESRNVPSMLLALIHPREALGINTHPLGQLYRTLTKRTLFGWNPLTSAEYDEVLRFARALYEVLNAWGWQPGDLWDVQSFIWVALAENGAAQESDIEINTESQPVTSPTNLILYGPPGTGKTYATAWEAVRLCLGDDAAAMLKQDRPALMAEYRQLASDGRIDFVTFHQSFAYEDFVEGLRPTTQTAKADDEQGDTAGSAGFSLTPRPGVFKLISERARLDTGNAVTKRLDRSRSIYKIALGQRGTQEDRIREGLDQNLIHLGWGGDIDWSDDRFDDFEEIRKTWNAQKDQNASGKDPNIEMSYAFRSGLQVGDYVVISDGRDSFRAFGKVAGEYEFDANASFHPHRRKVEWIWRDDTGAERESFYPKYFRRQSAYRLDANLVDWDALETIVIDPNAERPVEGARPHVLVIDEINRANISKVFGELITLLEVEKRLGCENEVKVRLPYSGTSFGVPSNLHIIGTMNTADRSIALLDTALRRRFSFKELMPDPSRLDAASVRTGIALGSLLRTMNERIEYLFDREHQIGHAYFIHCETVADIHDVMRFRIIPLLAEYFYEDWSKVALVLGDAEGAGHFIKRTKLFAPSGMQSDGFDNERYRWDVREEFDDTAYDQFA